MLRRCQNLRRKRAVPKKLSRSHEAHGENFKFPVSGHSAPLFLPQRCRGAEKDWTALANLRAVGNLVSRAAAAIKRQWKTGYYTNSCVLLDKGAVAPGTHPSEVIRKSETLETLVLQPRR